MSLEKKLTMLKHEVKGVLLSSPRGMTVSDFLKDYKSNVGKNFPFLEFGYKSISEFLKSMDDVLIFQPGNGAVASQLIPVVSSKVGHINNFVQSQKPSGKKYYAPPRRTVVLDNEEPQQRSRTASSHYGSSAISRSSNTDGFGNIKSDLHSNASTVERGKNYHEGRDTPIPPLKAGRGKSGYSDERNQPIQDWLEYQQNDTDSRDFQDGTHCYDDDYHDSLSASASSANFQGPDENYVNHMDDAYLNRPSTPDDRLSIKMKENIRLIVQENPGLPASKLCSLYYEKFQYRLKFPDYGYSGIKELIANIPDVIKYRQLSSDWILYDAREKSTSGISKSSTKWIPTVFQDKIAALAANYPQGLEGSLLFDKYKETYHEVISLKIFNIDSLEELLELCKGVDYKYVNHVMTIFPVIEECDNSNSLLTSRALPTTSDLNDLWNSSFSADECNPLMRYKPLELPSVDKLNFSWVLVCDVINPNDMWLQLVDAGSNLEKLMYELNEFYNAHSKGLVLDPDCIFQELMCTVRFSGDGRWHRAKVLSIQDGMIKVQYVDYGTVNSVQPGDLHKLRKEFYDLPTQAFNVSLHNLTYPNGETTWSMPAIEFIYEYSYDQKFRIQVFGTPQANEKLEVVLHYLDSEDTLNDILLSSQIASYAGLVPDCKSSEVETLQIMQSSDGLHSELLPPTSQESTCSSKQDLPKRVRTPPGYSSRSTSTLNPDNNMYSSLFEELQEMKNAMEETTEKFNDALQSLAVLQTIFAKIAMKVGDSIYEPSDFKKFHDAAPSMTLIQEVRGGGGHHKRKGHLVAPSNQVIGNSTPPSLPHHISAPHPPPPPHSFQKPFNPREQFPQQHMPQSMYQVNLGAPLYPSHMYSNAMRGSSMNSWGQQVVRQGMAFPGGPYAQGQPMNYPMQPNGYPGNMQLPPYPGVPQGLYQNGSYPPYQNSRCPAPVQLSMPQQFMGYPQPGVPNMDLPMRPSLSNTSLSNTAPTIEPKMARASSIDNKYDVKITDAPDEKESVRDGKEEEIIEIVQVNECLSESKEEAATIVSSEATAGIEVTVAETEVLVEDPLPTIPDPTVKLLELMKEDDNSFKEPSDSDGEVPFMEPTNYAMKIRVFGAEEPIYLLLLYSEDLAPCIVVSLFQLYENYSNQDKLYENFCKSITEDKSSPVFMIMCDDYPKVFNFLKSVNLAKEEDKHALVLSLSDVSLILDDICPEDMSELTNIKETFKVVSQELTVADSFWWSEARANPA